LDGARLTIRERREEELDSRPSSQRQDFSQRRKIGHGVRHQPPPRAEAAARSLSSGFALVWPNPLG
jgi:hypothetical protein